VQVWTRLPAVAETTAVLVRYDLSLADGSARLLTKQSKAATPPQFLKQTACDPEQQYWNILPVEAAIVDDVGYTNEYPVYISGTCTDDPLETASWYILPYHWACHLCSISRVSYTCHLLPVLLGVVLRKHQVLL
jgi:hypothetical protein